LPAQQGSPGFPHVAQVPVWVLFAPWQTSPDAQLFVPPQQMSPADWPHDTHIVLLFAPPVEVHRAPESQRLFAQHMVFGAPQTAQMLLPSQTVPLLQFPPAQQGCPGPPQVGLEPPVPLVGPAPAAPPAPAWPVVPLPAAPVAPAEPVLELPPPPV
jgi:hypothetical protein